MFQNLIYFSKNYKNTLFLYFYNFPMVQNCADQYGKGNRKDNSKASRKPLHNRDSNIIGIDDLLIRKVVSIVQKKHTYTASCKSKNQSIAVRSHHISCHMHSKELQQEGVIMISFIRGTVADLTENSVVIESGYIGFEVNMTGNALAQLHIGQEVKLHTYFQVREDAMVLYGFFNKDDLQVFKLLLGVNGVGPKAALGVLAGITADELRFAILSDDVKTLSKAPGIGKKTAQKLILELKDKLNLEEAFEQKMANEQAQATVAAAGTGMTDARQEAVEALVALGYSSTDALRAVRKVTDTQATDVEAILKAALKNF